jgi:hypothetical protein
MLTLDQPVDEDVTELVKQSSQLTGNSQHKAGILLYREPPDTLFRMRMAEVRLRDHFILIPIPFAAIEQALLDGSTASGLLAQYTDRYLPGADLFDDRNAIGDTLSFFGRVELLNRLEEELRRNQGIGLFGLRKSGKTSILLQLSFAMRQHPVVHIDLQRYGGKQRYGAELFNQVLQQLIKLVNEHHPQSKDTNFNWVRSRHFSAKSAKALTTNAKALTTNFKPFSQDSPAPDLISEFTQHINTLSPLLQEAGYHLPILCFLDEIERILPTKTDAKERTEEFNACFGVLRVLSQEQRQLSLLVADVHADCNRINQWQQPDGAEFIVRQEWANDAWSYLRGLKDTDTAINPFLGFCFSGYRDLKDYQQRVGSPLLNIADVEWLGTLTESNTRSLIVQRSQNEGVPLTESGYNTILDWAGYHPYLTQQLINEIFDDYQMRKSRSTESFMLHQQRKHDRDFSAWWDEDQRSYGFSQVEQTVYRTLVQQREGTAETVAEQAQFSFGQVADALEVLTGTGVIRQLDDERYRMGSKLFEEWVVRERR